MEQAMAGAQFDEANLVREELYIPILVSPFDLSILLSSVCY